MRFRDWAFLVGAASAATLVYGALYEAENLILERRILRLARWPKSCDGYKIALLGDLHIRDEYSLALARRAIACALDQSPDMVAMVGDYVSYWKPNSAEMLREVLEPLLLMEGSVVAIPGNHDYWLGSPALLAPIFTEFNIRLLRNESWVKDGIRWVGIDSANAKRADAEKALQSKGREPRIVLWHEPDMVDRLPIGAALMLSGHSHGGQFRFPGGFTPMHTENGRKYVRGFHPEAPTPIYVTRGVGTTGPPSRFLCAPEVALLTLVHGE